MRAIGPRRATIRLGSVVDIKAFSAVYETLVTLRR